MKAIIIGGAFGLLLLIGCTTPDIDVGLSEECNTSVTIEKVCQ